MALAFLRPRRLLLGLAQITGNVFTHSGSDQAHLPCLALPCLALPCLALHHLALPCWPVCACCCRCAADEEEAGPGASGRTGAGADSDGGGTDQAKERKRKAVRFEQYDDQAFEELMRMQEVGGWVCA